MKLKNKIFLVLTLCMLISQPSQAFVGDCVKNFGVFRTIMSVLIVVGVSLAGTSEGPKNNLGTFIGGIVSAGVGVLGFIGYSIYDSSQKIVPATAPI